MNQSDTNPLATALAALMTGHNANPNTSLRIPLVDSNGNLQPGPTLAELASVLGGVRATSSGYSGSLNDLSSPSIVSYGAAATNTPFTYGVVITFQKVGNYQVQIAFNVSSGKKFATRIIPAEWNLYD